MLSAATTRRQQYSRAGTPLPRTDLRAAAARRFRDLVNSLETELGGGELSAGDQALVKTAASMIMQIERLQTAIARGKSVTNDEIIRASSEARRILSALNAKAAAAKPDGPTELDQYLQDNYGSRVEADEGPDETDAPAAEPEPTS